MTATSATLAIVKPKLNLTMTMCDTPNPAYKLYCKCYGLNRHPPLKYKPVKKLEFHMQLVDSLVNHFTNRKLVGPTVTPVVSLVPNGHKVVDLRPLRIHAGRCEFCSTGPHKTAGKRKKTQFSRP